MSKKDNQPRLFDGERIRRNRRPYKRVSRSKDDIAPFVRFLRTYRMIADANDGKVKIKELQDKFRIGHFARSAMPADILTIDEVKINADYAEAWRKSLYNYYKDCDRLCKGIEYTYPEPIIVMQEPSKPSLAELMEDLNKIGSQFIATITNKILEIQNIINFQNQSL